MPAVNYIRWIAAGVVVVEALLGCDATTLWAERPEAEFRWYDTCVAGPEALVIATTFLSGTPAVVLRSAVATVKVGEDLTLDAWTAPDPAPVLSARSELVVRYPLLDPALAVLTLGANARYCSPDLSLLQARAGQSTTEVLSATYTMHGPMSCH